MNELALFAGAGGGILGGKLLGWRTVCAVEREPYAASVLVARQNDGFLPPFPIWDDVQTFDGNQWRGRIDVVSGGFPCQDISAAGKGAGIDGERSGMWFHMARIIGEVRPRFAFVENSPMLTSRGLGRVLGDLAALGYDARWGVLGAVDAGAPHRRERIWIVAESKSSRCEAGGACRWTTQRFAKLNNRGADAINVAHSDSGRGHQDSSLCKLWASGTEQPPEDSWLSNPNQVAEITQEVADINVPQRKGSGVPSGIYSEHANTNQPGSWWATDPADAIESSVGRVAHGVAARVDRLKAIGNGQVPAVAALAWNVLKPIPERLVVHPVP
jgi:DNA (cytosine-5)-methyltransferase 1